MCGWGSTLYFIGWAYSASPTCKSKGEIGKKSIPQTKVYHYSVRQKKVAP